MTADTMSHCESVTQSTLHIMAHKHQEVRCIISGSNLSFHQEVMGACGHEGYLAKQQCCEKSNVVGNE